MTKFNVLTVC